MIFFQVVNSNAMERSYFIKNLDKKGINVFTRTFEIIKPKKLKYDERITKYSIQIQKKYQ